MNAKCIYSKTIEELIKSPQHFEDGTIAIIDDNKCYVYNNGWNPISNVQMENELLEWETKMTQKADKN